MLHYATWIGFLLALALTAGMVGLARLGYRLGRRSLAGGASDTAGWGALEAAVFGLLGLLVAFSFSGAADRFQQRKSLIVQEVQAIGTAWDRLDLLPEPARSEIRGQLRAYVDQRLAVFENMADLDEVDRRLALLEKRGGEVWRLAAAACREPSGQPYVEVVPPAVNQVLDVGVARKAALRNHPPLVIFALLVALALACAFLAGWGMAPNPRFGWVHAAAFALVMGLTIYVIADLELPRIGLIRVEAADELLRQLRRGME